MNEKNAKILAIELQQSILNLLDETDFDIVDIPAYSLDALNKIDFSDISLCILSDDIFKLEDLIFLIKSQPLSRSISVFVVASHKKNEEMFKAGADAFMRVEESAELFISEVYLLLGINNPGVKSINPDTAGSMSAFFQAFNTSKSLNYLPGKDSLAAKSDLVPEDTQSIKQFISMVASTLKTDELSSIPPSP